MGFHQIKNCKRPPWAQKVLFEIIQHLEWFPPEYRAEMYRLLEEITEDPLSGRALFLVVTGRMDVSEASWKFCVPEGRLRKMKAAFYDRYLDGVIRKW